MEKYLEKRPWGNFERFCENYKCTVKLLNVNPNVALSLQYHNYRSEFWRILHGSAKITIGEEIIKGGIGDEFFIPQGTLHRIETTKEPTQILEIHLGHYDEDDIVRLEDKYGRDNLTPKTKKDEISNT